MSETYHVRITCDACGNTATEAIPDPEFVSNRVRPGVALADRLGWSRLRIMVSGKVPNDQGGYACPNPSCLIALATGFVTSPKAPT